MPLTVAPGDSAAVVVKFTATEYMPLQQTVLNGTSDQGTFAVSMQGLSLWADIKSNPGTFVLPMQKRSRLGTFTASNPTIDFGSMPTGDTCLKFTEIVNTGTLPLEFEIACEESAFIPTPKRFARAPGDRQIVEVAFSPPDTETHSTAFVLTDHPRERREHSSPPS
jgi:hypothetical protein